MWGRCQRAVRRLGDKKRKNKEGEEEEEEDRGHSKSLNSPDK